MIDAPPETCRIDVWLWRARFFKTRGQAAGFVEAGAVRLTHRGRQARLDKPSRLVRPGDRLVFVLNERLIELTVVGLGARRGPAPEARALYELADPS
ncbi:RNA-binding S4 domain-containing protein [Brevundimonas sp.]|uniref:RNA-binding S4 domain-containing protein n=1 Tax=Brevundimonas sp. TaxID=1871086 RepID=UPI0035AFC72F